MNANTVGPPLLPPPPPPSLAKSRRPWRHLWRYSLVGLLVLASGFAAGWGFRDSQASEQRTRLEGQLDAVASDHQQATGRADDLQAELQLTQSQRDELKRRLDAAEQANKDIEARTASLDEREAQLDERQTAIEQTEAGIEANTVNDGVWTVGLDIEPGTYRASDVSSSCYWAILRSGTNGDDIIANDLPGGGNPQVTIEDGQDFETVRCGEWTKMR